MLHIRPTFVADELGEEFLLNGNLTEDGCNWDPCSAYVKIFFISLHDNCIIFTKIFTFVSGQGMAMKLPLLFSLLV